MNNKENNMDINGFFTKDPEGRLRIIQEGVPGKQISLAHIIGSPRPIVYQKLGLNPDIDFTNSAIGILNVTPPETAIIASDIAVKAGDIYLGFVDRFSGTLVIAGGLSDVNTAMEEVVTYLKRELDFAVCKITRR